MLTIDGEKNEVITMTDDAEDGQGIGNEQEGTRSSYSLSKMPCNAMVARKDGSQAQCQRLGVGQTKDEQWWCGLHHPDKKAEREAKKEREAQIALEESPEKASLVGQAISAAEKAMVILNEIRHIRDIGWPENSPPEKYRVLLQTINLRAGEAAEQLRHDLVQVKNQL